MEIESIGIVISCPSKFKQKLYECEIYW